MLCIIVDIVLCSIHISSYPLLKKRKDSQQSYWPMIGKCMYMYACLQFYFFRIDKLFQTVQSVAQAPSLAKVRYTCICTCNTCDIFCMY